MKPLDPRLLRHARSARGFLALGAGLGLVQAAALIAFAWLVATAITEVIAGIDVGTAPDSLPGTLWALCAAVAVRAAAGWVMDWASARAGATAASELRQQLLTAIARHGRARLGASTAELTSLTGHGLEALETYFGKYLPQLLLSVSVTPLVIGVTLLADPISGITELVTLPIIPVFMVLIGLATRQVQQRQLGALTRLSEAFLEIVEGLSTLKIFGRAERQRGRVAAITEEYRRSTMKVLRLSFLSGFALELFASLAVALVAVQIGIRLIDDAMALQIGLFALILAPEAFAPIRQVGAQFHAAADGVAAADRVFELLAAADADGADSRSRAAAAQVGISAQLSTPMPDSAPSEASAQAPISPQPQIPASAGTEAFARASTRLPAPPSSHSPRPAVRSVETQASPASETRHPRPTASVEGIELRRVAASYGDRGVLDGLDASFPRGAVTAIAGPSGAGKSTLLELLRGAPAGAAAGLLLRGTVLLDGKPIEPTALRERVAWMGQRSALLAGTVRANVALGAPELSDAAVGTALATAGLPASWIERELGVGGEGVSGGQAQRLALARLIARARHRDSDVVLADEPTSALDAEREQLVIAALRALAAEGRAVVVVSHRPAVLAGADRVLRLSAREAVR